MERSNEFDFKKEVYTCYEIDIIQFLIYDMSKTHKTDNIINLLNE